MVFGQVYRPTSKSPAPPPPPPLAAPPPPPKAPSPKAPAASTLKKPSLAKLGGQATDADRGELLKALNSGDAARARLRPTQTRDKSAPAVTAEIEEEKPAVPPPRVVTTPAPPPPPPPAGIAPPPPPPCSPKAFARPTEEFGTREAWRASHRCGSWSPPEGPQRPGAAQADADRRQVSASRDGGDRGEGRRREASCRRGRTKRCRYAEFDGRLVGWQPEQS
ncbi:hypothetical protein AAVH_28707 [Aphelenchoides avenae]|nr:hypothetical protein AAVH_28707 [Aphelenchus avenae]